VVIVTEVSSREVRAMEGTKGADSAAYTVPA